MDWPFDPARPIPVGALNRCVRQALERALPLLWVEGEVSNLVRAASGHHYFALKDAEAQVRCVLFRQRAAQLDWTLRDGDAVEVRATPTLYEARGEFQLTIDSVRRAGQGRLYEAFERLKQALDREGLFHAARKRPLPALPRQIGIVTSPAGAALHDVLTTLRRRMPSIPVVIYPTPVQGAGAGARIAAALAAAGARAECDVLILCRGGGSLEDLWAFNEEGVARALAACPLPVVSGIGHETDFTIADFVADLRAATPTAAAEQVCPDRQARRQTLRLQAQRLQRAQQRRFETAQQHLDHLARRLVHPGTRLQAQGETLQRLAVRLHQAETAALEQRAWRLERLGSRLAPAMQARLADWQHRLASPAAALPSLNPHAVLERGYSLVQTGDGTLVRTPRQAPPGTALQITLAGGTLDAHVDPAVP